MLRKIGTACLWTVACIACGSESTSNPAGGSDAAADSTANDAGTDAAADSAPDVVSDSEGFDAPPEASDATSDVPDTCSNENNR